MSFKQLFNRFFVGPSPVVEKLSPVVIRVPRIAEAVWWAAKGLEGVVTKLGRVTFEFQSGPPVKRQNGTIVPHRYTTAARIEDVRWDDSLHSWIVGQGASPKTVRGKVIYPKPVIVSGRVS